MSAKRVLVTGGAGFIGTHVCRALVKAGCEVRVLDIATPKNSVDEVQYERCDVRDSKAVTRMVDGVDAVYHFAAMVSVPECQEKPVESFETNLMATTTVAEAVRREMELRKKKIRITFAGSSAVYGTLGKEGVPLVEDEISPYPLSFYAAQKLGSEHVLQLYRENFGVLPIIFRFFNVYGPGQEPTSPYSGVISIFTKMVREKGLIKLNGGGAQTRDFVSVHDIANACMKALELDPKLCDGLPINLGTGKSVTIKELAQTTMKAGKAETKTEDAPPRSGDVMHSMSNIFRARKVLGWEPKMKLVDGLAELF